MIELAIAVFVGLMLGWNFLPQPKWAKALYAKVAGWFGSIPPLTLE